MKFFITKWALSDGIREREGEPNEDGWVYVKRNVWQSQYERLGTHAHKTREEAEAKAEKMRRAKIASLQKQIAKLNAMSFGEDAA